MNEWMTDESMSLGWAWVGLLWDKKHKTHIVRKSTLRLQNFWSFDWANIEQDTAI